MQCLQYYILKLWSQIGRWSHICLHTLKLPITKVNEVIDIHNPDIQTNTSSSVTLGQIMASLCPDK